MNPMVKHFFDKATWTLTYVVYDAPRGTAAIIDSVLDYDPKSGRTRTHSADQVVEFVKAEGLTVAWILETHAHADHLSAAKYLREHLGGKIGIGNRITTVQGVFKEIFNLEAAFKADGHQFVVQSDRDFAEVDPGLPSWQVFLRDERVRGFPAGHNADLAASRSDVLLDHPLDEE